jgi:hypothetical protein
MSGGMVTETITTTTTTSSCCEKVKVVKSHRKPVIRRKPTKLRPVAPGERG